MKAFFLHTDSTNSWWSCFDSLQIPSQIGRIMFLSTGRRGTQGLVGSVASGYPGETDKSLVFIMPAAYYLDAK